MDANAVLEHYKVPESNVFLMTRFNHATYHCEISDSVEYSLRAFGLEFVRADDRNWFAPTLWDRVRSCLDACQSGVAVFETIDETDFNPNVSLELGYMLALRRQCLLLKEKRLERLPTDLCGHLYKEFDSRNISETVTTQVVDWLKEIGARKRDGERLVVFVSAGGIDRCAIAKVVARHLLSKKQDEALIRIESRGIHRPTRGSATNSGRRAIMNLLGADLLLEHRPRKVGVGFLFEADLILAMDRDVMSQLAKVHLDLLGTSEDRVTVQEELLQKTFLVSEFFGSSGDIEDPYPDEGDENSLRRYEECARLLRDLIAPEFGRIKEFLWRSAPNPGAMKRTVAFGARRLSP